MRTLVQFKKFIDEITISNSRLYKISVLEKYKDVPAIKYYLRFVYDPYVSTGISDRKFGKTYNGTLAKSFPDHLCSLLDWLKDNNTGTDVILATVKGSIDHILGRPICDENSNQIYDASEESKKNLQRSFATDYHKKSSDRRR